MSVREDLERFARLIVKWNAVQNLVSRETLGTLWPRHIEDSLQLVRLLRDTDRAILDIGSGGGFPAIPLAIATKGQGRRFTLVEPIGKKVAFLRAAARELGLPVTVLAARAETLDSRETFDLVTSRALAGLGELLSMSHRLLRRDGHMLLHKGRNFRQELDAASAQYDFDVVVHPSESDPEGVILEISNLQAKSAA